MKKRLAGSWKKLLILPILCASCHGTAASQQVDPVNLQSPASRGLALKEAQVARQAARGEKR